MKKTRILFVVYSLSLGGVEKSLLSILGVLDPEKYDITVGVANAEGGLLEAVPDYVKVVEIPSLHRHLPKLMGRPANVMASVKEGRLWEAFMSALTIGISQLRGTLIPHFRYFVNERTEADMPEYDVAVAYQGPNELIDYYVSLVKARRKIGWVHFDVSKAPIRRATVRRLYPAYYRVMVVSQSAKDIFDRLHPAAADRTEMMHNIIDTAQIARGGAVEGIFQPEAGVLNIVTVGRMRHEKGQDIAIRTAAELKRRGVRFKWTFAGTGRYLDACRQLATRLGVDDCVEFVGAVLNPYPFMARCDVYVQPSRQESFGISVCEAKVFGVPIVATDFASARELLHDVPNAEVVATHSPAEIADAVLRAAEAGRIEAQTGTVPPQKERLDRLFRLD